MSVSRREFLAGSVAASAAGAATLFHPAATTAAPTLTSSIPDTSSLSPGSFSFIPLTDQHVTNRRHAPEGYAKCIAALNAVKPAPDFVLMGGDMVFDGGYTALDDYKQQIHLFKDITRDLKYPWHPCLGNHDV